MSGKDWSIAGVWNASLEAAVVKPYEPRDHLWASELGSAPIDIFHKLKGTAVTNPPNARSKRKFEAGNVFEWILTLMLKRAGILLDTQVRAEHKYAGGFMPVTGKLDLLAGGKPDFARAIAELKALDMPEVFVRAAEAMKAYFDANYPSGLEAMPIEIKSLSGLMFEGLLARGNASKNHRLQLFHYIKSLGYEKGKILYICRDDLRLMEFTVMNGGVFETEYMAHIEELSGYYYRNEVPPLEEPVVYDPDTGKFAANWKVAYSQYLTMLYGIKDQAEFDAKYKGLPARWNGTLKRFRDGKKMTKLNLERMKEIHDAGFDIAKIAMS